MKLNVIKIICDKENISIDELAEKIGVTNTTLYRSLKEKVDEKKGDKRKMDMKVSTLEKICNALKVEPEEFFDLSFVSKYEQLKTAHQDLISKYEKVNIAHEELKIAHDGQTKTHNFVLGQIQLLNDTLAKEKEHNQSLKDVIDLYKRLENKQKQDSQ